MNTCDTCKHWGNVSWNPIRITKVITERRCEATSQGVDPQTIAISLHDGNFASDFFTGPKFGCVHHEPLNPLSECPGCWDSKCIHTCGK